MKCQYEIKSSYVILHMIKIYKNSKINNLLRKYYFLINIKSLRENNNIKIKV